MGLEEDYRVCHTVNPGIHRKLPVVLQVLLAHNARMEVGRRKVASVGLIQAFLHHTSYDAEVAPFLPAGRLLEIVQDIHGQALQDCQGVEFV